MAALALLLVAAFALDAQADRGIGGTGGPPLRPAGQGPAKPPGTTIVGTIVKFGSVYANGFVVDADENTPRENLAGLALGQVVQIQTEAAVDNQEKLVGRRIVGDPVVTGPVERAYARGNLLVLGQEVALQRSTHLQDGLDVEKLGLGQAVTVYGLRDADGVVRATRIELAGTAERPATALVRGRLSPGPDGRMRVGGVTLSAPVDAGWIGRIVQVHGRVAGPALLEPLRLHAWPLLEGGANRVSLEAYLGRDLRPDRMDLDGLAVALPRGTFIRTSILEPGQHVVVDMVRGADGAWVAERVEAPPTEATLPPLPNLPRDLPIPPPLPPIFLPNGVGPSSNGLR